MTAFEGKSGPDMLTPSSSLYDPQETLGPLIVIMLVMTLTDPCQFDILPIPTV
jgi:hypothetical protein